MKIYFHISGRLGNQLFEWAFLHELVERGYSVYLFIDKYHNNFNNVDLVRVLQKCEHLPDIQVRNDLGFLLRVYEKLESLGGIFLKISRWLPVYIEAFPVSKKLRLFPTVIDGYFIDKKWVELHEKILLEELQLALSDLPKDDFLQSLDSKALTTKIHVRRGDYNLYKTTFGLLSKNYYHLNLDKNEEIVVFSDSVGETSKMLNDFTKIIFIDPAKHTVWDALLIMSQSKKLILSNSTFAWWAGFLALKISDAKVFIPNPFYYKRSKFDHRLALDGFIQVDSSFE